MIFTVEVDLCLTRPPRVQRISRVIIEADSAGWAELQAISMASTIHGAEMPLASRIIDWTE